MSAPARPAAAPLPMAPVHAPLSVDPTLMLVASLQAQMVSCQAQIAALDARVRELEAERRGAAPSAAPIAPAENLTAFREREKAAMLEALTRTDWNRSEAGRILGMPRRTFYRRMVEYGIQEGDQRSGVAKRERARKKN